MILVNNVNDQKAQSLDRKIIIFFIKKTLFISFFQQLREKVGIMPPYTQERLPNAFGNLSYK